MTISKEFSLSGEDSPLAFTKQYILSLKTPLAEGVEILLIEEGGISHFFLKENGEKKGKAGGRLCPEAQDKETTGKLIECRKQIENRNCFLKKRSSFFYLFSKTSETEVCKKVRTVEFRQHGHS